MSEWAGTAGAVTVTVTVAGFSGFVMVASVVGNGVRGLRVELGNEIG